MRIVFVSNYYNHHQKEVSETLYSLTLGEYRFIETSYMEKERKELGWGEKNKPEYVLNIQDSVEMRNICKDYIDSADVIITGSAPEYLFRNAVRHHKLILRYAERPFKDRNIYNIRYPLRLLKYHISTLSRKNIYMLCSSAYTAADYSKFFLFRNRTIRWGYFPETNVYPNIEDAINKKMAHSILWCGRFLDWKHPDDVIRMAKRLRDEGIIFSLKMVGIGPMFKEIKFLINEYELNDIVELKGSMQSKEVRSLMEETEILLFTSDYNEGWGAVLNEAMNSACAVVASHAAGSTPFLVSDGENGYIYRSGDIDQLTEKVKALLNNRQLRCSLGKCAYETITKKWNAINAAERLYNICASLLEKEDASVFYLEGPCSKAPIIEDDWFEINSERCKYAK